MLVNLVPPYVAVMSYEEEKIFKYQNNIEILLFYFRGFLKNLKWSNLFDLSRSETIKSSLTNTVGRLGLRR